MNKAESTARGPKTERRFTITPPRSSSAGRPPGCLVSTVTFTPLPASALESSRACFSAPPMSG
ncbi:MAG: hypothetical protein A3J70_00255 [Elusimicrobia bacterium RIFCSPHIGHO2_02_FULL_61_10]|nr:MAG: hypothetical protein A3J70_00255 [Elusimicrobia bacterium RIFCSPHIGHO2_02_FULL_61_10]